MYLSFFLGIVLNKEVKHWWEKSKPCYMGKLIFFNSMSEGLYYILGTLITN